MNRKVQIVRWWLLAISAVAWAILYRDPTLAIVPVAFFTGQASCFCCPLVFNFCPSLCDPGADTPITITMVLAGMANGTCANCATYDGTYAVDDGNILGDPLNCEGRFVGDPFTNLSKPCGAHAASNLIWRYVASGGDTHLEGLVEIPCASPTTETHLWSDNRGASPATCIGLSMFGLTWISGTTTCASSTMFCDSTAATMTITTNP